MLTLTQLYGGLVGDFTNPPEVGIQLADASLYAADGLSKPEGVPGSHRQRGGQFLERRGVPPQPLSQLHLHVGDRGDAPTDQPDVGRVSAQRHNSLGDAAAGRHPLDDKRSRHIKGVQVASSGRSKDD